MRTNEERADNGRELAASAYHGGTEIAEQDYREGLVDALTNLMHFARRHDLPFAMACEMAERHHAAEARYPWDEIPE
jgi:hypothetical protein